MFDTLNYLKKLFGGSQQTSAPVQQRQMIPTGQRIPQEYMNSYDPQTKSLAQIYDRNPQDPRVSGVDPKIFGYAPDASTRQVMPKMSGNSYNQDGISSVGGRFGVLGGTIGLDHGRPFVNANIGGKPVVDLNFSDFLKRIGR